MTNLITKYPKAFALAVLFHILVGLIFIVNFHFDRKHHVDKPVDIVKATAVNESQVQQELDKLKAIEDKKRKAEADRLKKLERDAARAKQKRQKELKRLKALEQKRKREERKEKQLEKGEKEVRMLSMKVFHWNNIVAGLLVLMFALILAVDALLVTFGQAGIPLSDNDVKGITGFVFAIIAAFFFWKASKK